MNARLVGLKELYPGGLVPKWFEGEGNVLVADKVEGGIDGPYALVAISELVGFTAGSRRCCQGLPWCSCVLVHPSSRW